MLAEWVSYVGFAVLHTHIELAFGIGVGLAIAGAAIMPFRSRTYWSHRGDD